MLYLYGHQSVRLWVSTLLIALVFLAFPAQASSDGVAAKVLQFKGEVFYQRGNSRQPLDKSSKIMQGDTVITAASGRVKLLLSEGNNQVVIGASTQLTIERVGSASRGESGTVLSLKEGKVRSTVNKEYSGEGIDVFQVRTPNSVAGVRGTVFLVTYEKSTFQSRIATERGAVAWKSLGREVLVSKGMFSSVSGQVVSPPAKIESNPAVMKDIQELSESSDLGARDDVSVENQVTAAPKQESFVDADGNEVLVNVDSSASSGSGRSLASVPSDTVAAPEGAASSSTLSTQVSVDSDLTKKNVTNVAPVLSVPSSQGSGSIPGLNADAVQETSSLVKKNASSLRPASFQVTIE